MNKEEIIIDIDDLLSKEIGSKEDKKIDSDIKNIDETELLGGVHGSVHLTNLGEGVLAHLEINAKSKQICSRCAKDYDHDIKLDYKQMYQFSAGDDVFPITSDKKIDLWPSIRQEIIINMPMKPLCNNCCKE